MGHYSAAFEPQRLRSLATDFVLWWEARMNVLDIPMFVYRGMSGAAHATAHMLEWQRAMPRTPFEAVYVRKPGESSHSCSTINSTLPLEQTSPHYPLWDECHKIVFVDDFVSSGETFLSCMEAIGMFRYLPKSDEPWVQRDKRLSILKTHEYILSVRNVEHHRKDQADRDLWFHTGGGMKSYPYPGLF